MHIAIGNIVSAAMAALHCLSLSPSNCAGAAASGVLPVVAAQLEAALAAALDGDSCSPALGLLKMYLDLQIRFALQVRRQCCWEYSTGVPRCVRAPVFALRRSTSATQHCKRCPLQIQCQLWVSAV